MAVTRTSGRRRCASSSSSTRSTCARGRGEESVERVEYTRRTIEAIVPAWFDKPVSAITDADMFAFRSGRASGGGRSRVRSTATCERSGPRSKRLALSTAFLVARSSVRMKRLNLDFTLMRP
jgi:hypothetical protein